MILYVICISSFFRAELIFLRNKAATLPKAKGSSIDRCTFCVSARYFDDTVVKLFCFLFLFSVFFS